MAVYRCTMSRPIGSLRDSSSKRGAVCLMAVAAALLVEVTRAKWVQRPKAVANVIESARAAQAHVHGAVEGPDEDRG